MRPLVLLCCYCCMAVISQAQYVQYTTPPTSPVRAPAEWEELQAVLIVEDATNANNDLVIEIIRHVQKECTAIVATPNPDSLEQVLRTKGIDPSFNIEFLDYQTNRFWVRDYGPTAVYTNDVDSLVLVDWIYNRDRIKDDAYSEILAQQLELPLYAQTQKPYDLVHAGGNLLVDGRGTAFSSKLILGENSDNNIYGESFHSSAAIDQLMQQFMGINTYIKMDMLPFDVIHHVDMHMKILDEETLLVGQYIDENGTPIMVADAMQIEENLSFILENFKTVFNTDFKVIRIPMPPDKNGGYPDDNNHCSLTAEKKGCYRTYTNALFVNKTILVPTYEEKYDSTALRIWREAKPGYTIVGLNCDNIIRKVGAIHCITKELGVADPLWISHQKVVDNQLPVAGSYPIKALIKHRSGIQQASLWYKTALEDDYQSIVMSKSTDEADHWQALLPEQTHATTIYYYISATALSGKYINHPIAAPAAYHHFKNQLVANEITSATKTRLDRIYPNPSNTITCIPITAEQSIDVKIQLKNTLGQSIRTVYKGRVPSGESKYFINAQDLKAGAYLVELQTNSASFIQKLIIR